MATSTGNKGKMKFDQLGRQPQLVGKVGFNHDFDMDLPEIPKWRIGF